MDLSPDDIVGFRFKQTLRGYAIEEVDELLDQLADQVERHQEELAHLQRRVEAAEATAASTRETEATLQRTLVVAQQAAERNLADASAQAEATIAAATADAERVRREAEEEAGRVRSEARSEADRTLEEAQTRARNEVDAARDRVEDAARRHGEVLISVAEHRDALRAHLATLEELALAAPPVPAPSEPELVAGELPDESIAVHGDPAGDDGAGDDVAGDDVAGEDLSADDLGGEDPFGEHTHGAQAWRAESSSPLTVRVHDGHGDPDGRSADGAGGSDDHADERDEARGASPADG